MKNRLAPQTVSRRYSYDWYLPFLFDATMTPPYPEESWQEIRATWKRCADLVSERASMSAEYEQGKFPCDLEALRAIEGLLRLLPIPDSLDTWHRKTVTTPSTSSASWTSNRMALVKLLQAMERDNARKRGWELLEEGEGL